MASQELTTFLARAAAFRAGGPLHYCVLHGGEAPAAAATRHLLDAGVPPDQQDAKGRSAATLCALVGDTRTARMLLDAGASAALPDACGATPLHACFSPAVAQQALQEACCLADSSAQPATAAPAPGGDRLAVAELLLHHLAGGQVDAATHSEQATPLMHAASAGSAAGVGLLLGASASRDAVDCRGRTALMLAASAGCTDAMQLLLRPPGGDPPHPTAAVDLQSSEEGRTALCYAIEARQRPAAELLLAAQARLDLVPKPLLQQLVGLLFAGKQGVEAELRDAQAASSKAASASAASATALKAATAERDAAQRTAADAERSAAAARQQAEAAQKEVAALQSKLQAAEAAAAQLGEEAAGLRAQQEAEAGRAVELQLALDSAAAQQAAAEQSFKEQTAALEMQALDAAAAASEMQRRLQNEVDVLRQRVERRQQECERLRFELDRERSKGFWARLLGGGKAKVAPEQESWASDAAEAAGMPAGQPAASDSWRSPHTTQAPPVVPGGVPAAGGVVATGNAAASGEVESVHDEVQRELSACAEQPGEASAGEAVAGSNWLASGGVAKGGPATAPVLHSDNAAAAASLKAQAAAAAAGEAEGSPSTGNGGRLGAWGAAVAAAPSQGGGIPAFRPESQQLEAALEALLAS